MLDNGKRKLRLIVAACRSVRRSFAGGLLKWQFRIAHGNPVDVSGWTVGGMTKEAQMGQFTR